MARIGTIPMGASALEVFVEQVSESRSRMTGIPVADDLDINGACLCGCGYRAKDGA